MPVHRRLAPTLLRFILCPLACPYVDMRLVRIDWRARRLPADAAPKQGCSENPRPDASALAETALPRSTVAEPLLASSLRALPVCAYYPRSAWWRFRRVRRLLVSYMTLAPSFGCARDCRLCHRKSSLCPLGCAADHCRPPRQRCDHCSSPAPPLRSLSLQNGGAAPDPNASETRRLAPPSKGRRLISHDRAVRR